MFIANDVPCRRGSTDAARCVSIDMPAGEDHDIVCLMFEVLGWQLAGPVRAGGTPGADGDCRLQIRSVGGVLHIGTGDRRLAGLLACCGLDRLTLPVALPALEQLMVVAG